MNFLIIALRVIGWLFLILVAIAAASSVVGYNWRYGIALAASEREPWMTGATLAIADVVKIGLPALIGTLWARTHRGMAGVLSVVFAMLFGLSFWASLSITTIERSDSDGKATNASKLESDLRTELAAAESRIVELGSPPPLKAVEAEIDGFKTDARWRTTEACNPLNVTPSTRRFCEQAALKQSAREKAAEADGLRTRMAEIRRTLTTPAPDAGKVASPELAAIASVSGWRPETVGLARAVFFALALELLGSFVPSAVWHLRPSFGTSSAAPKSAPQPARVADASRGTSPSAPRPAPTSPRLVRSEPRTTPSARRKSNGRSNLVSFAAAFTARYGRPPTTTEVKQEFPSASTTTAWRAIKDAAGGRECNVHGNALTA